ncbi:hypothetical protein K438DRAFT_2016434 [Mycena galopus ATCC 62051]|nr:hypothetical protein K438DRAFT_2016434 [Mycena galopus ATCC 62051]
MCSSVLVPATKQSTPAQLPHDILLEIFVLCVKTNPDPWVPVNLAQVCLSWRASALAAPPLWTNIVLHMYPRRRQKHLRPKAFLKRSCGMPVHMHIHVGRLQQLHEGALISSHAARLHTLTLTSHDREIAMDYVRYFSQIPFKSLALFRVFVPGQIDIHLVRESDSVVLLFTPCSIPRNGYRDFVWLRRLRAHDLTVLVLKGLGSTERPSLRQMWNILHESSGTLQHFDFEGWAPTNDVGLLISPINLPALRQLRIGYIDDITSLGACIYAPNLDIFALQDVLFCPAMLPYPEDRTIVQCNLPLLFQFLAPSCTYLSQLSLVGLAACARDATDAFFSGLSELTVLMLTLCDPTFADALFQPEARYRVPKAVFPKLCHLNISGAPQTDLARFLLRHKTVSVSPLTRLDITNMQFSEAYGRVGIRSILAVVLEMNSREGMAVYLVNDPRSVAISVEE